MSATRRPCPNRLCPKPLGKKKGKLGFCANCYELHRLKSCQPCYYCKEATLGNAAPPNQVRYTPGLVVCSLCAQRQKKAWSFLYDACASCGLTDQQHAAKGLCFSCYQGLRKHGATRKCGCGTPTLRNFSSEPTIRCVGCYRSRIKQIIEAVGSGARTRDVVREFGVSTANRTIIRAVRSGDVLAPKLKWGQVIDRRIIGDSSRSSRDSLHYLHARSQAGDVWANERLLKRIEPFVRSQLRGWYHPWGSFDDLLQEIMTDVWRALRLWRRGEASIWQYLEAVIQRSASAALKGATRGKHRILTNHSDSLDAPCNEGDDDRTGHDRLGHIETPEAIVLSGGASELVNPSDYTQPGTLNHALLSDFIAYGDGWSYDERAARLTKVLGRSIDRKSIDNARDRLAKLDNLRSFLREAASVAR